MKRKISGILLALAITVSLVGCAKAEVSKNLSMDEKAEVSASDTESISKLDFSEIEALAAECIYNVNWYTQEGDYSAGTSFLMESDTHGEKLLVTAFHYLWPDEVDTFTGSELPEYVTGGEIYSASTDEATGATIKNCLIIEDADVAPAINKDVAAFTVQNADGLKTLELASKQPMTGDKIYLLADLWDTEDVHENCVYEAEVISCEDGVLNYKIDSKYGTAGASGAPIVNEYGEVVAIHIGSGFAWKMAHLADSFMEQINQGTISDIVYPAEFASGEEEIPVYTLNREDALNSVYFDMYVDAVALTDSIQEVAAPEGYQYVIIDITLKALDSEPVYMYYSDFVLSWDEEYCLPLETGLTEKQLPDEYSVSESGTSGQLIFYAPKDITEMVLNYQDYFVYEEEVYYLGYYEVMIPVENWTR